MPRAWAGLLLLLTAGCVSTPTPEAAAPPSPPWEPVPVDGPARLVLAVPQGLQVWSVDVAAERSWSIDALVGTPDRWYDYRANVTRLGVMVVPRGWEQPACRAYDFATRDMFDARPLDGPLLPQLPPGEHHVLVWATYLSSDLTIYVNGADQEDEVRKVAPRPTAWTVGAAIVLAGNGPAAANVTDGRPGLVAVHMERSAQLAAWGQWRMETEVAQADTCAAAALAGEDRPEDPLRALGGRSPGLSLMSGFTGPAAWSAGLDAPSGPLGEASWHAIAMPLYRGAP